ncbi:uncharacterized protein DDB_G0290685-like isoform X2 [Sardina pilchardus]|uniref:uncharacterized protein DDB_G0290685-like isoform X2 n=1 Tax=Sardina pilchardus TaxID=27697 RepID=UPI002E0E6B2E
MTQSSRFWKRTIIFCIILGLFHGGYSNTITAATNQDVTLPSGVQGQIDEILWKYRGNKMVEWDKATGDITEYLTFKGRTKLDTRTGDVTIVKLTEGDSGLYEAEVVIGTELKSIKYEVKVIDPVAGAKITCSNSASTTTLHCEAEGDLLSFSWSGPGLQTEIRGQTGPQITKEKDQNSVYTCAVNNAVSNISVDYKASGCFASGNLQLIVGVVCSAVVAAAAAAAAGFGYYRCRKSKGQKNAGIETESESEGDEQRGQKDAENSKTSETQGGDDGEPLLTVEGRGDPEGQKYDGIHSKLKTKGGDDGESLLTGEDGGDSEDKIGEKNATEDIRGACSGHVKKITQTLEGKAGDNQTNPTQVNIGQSNKHDTRKPQAFQHFHSPTGQTDGRNENEHDTSGNEKISNLEAEEKEANSDSGQINTGSENEHESSGDEKIPNPKAEEKEQNSDTPGQIGAGDETEHETKGDQKTPSPKAKEKEQSSDMTDQKKGDGGDTEGKIGDENTAEIKRGASLGHVQRARQKFEGHLEAEGQKGTGWENEHQSSGDEKIPNPKAEEKEQNSDLTGQNNRDGGDTEGKIGDENAAESKRGASPGYVQRAKQRFEGHLEAEEQINTGGENDYESNGDQKIPNPKAEEKEQNSDTPGQKGVGGENEHEPSGDEKIPNPEAKEKEKNNDLTGQEDGGIENKFEPKGGDEDDAQGSSDDEKGAENNTGAVQAQIDAGDEKEHETRGDEKIPNPEAEEKEQNSDTTGQEDGGIENKFEAKGGDEDDAQGSSDDEKGAENNTGAVQAQIDAGDEKEHETRGDEKIPNPEAEEKEQNSDTTGQEDGGIENKFEPKGDEDDAQGNRGEEKSAKKDTGAGQTS